MKSRPIFACEIAVLLHLLALPWPATYAQEVPTTTPRLAGECYCWAVIVNGIGSKRTGHCR